VSAPAPVSRAALFAAVGEEVGVSGWMTVDQDMIDRFAALTGDRQFLHTDPARAARGPYGGTVAHGFLTLSLLTRMRAEAVAPVEGLRASINYGFDKVRFLAPVRAGARIRARFTRLSAQERRPGEITLVHRVSVEIEGEARPALVADWISRWMTEEGDK